MDGPARFAKSSSVGAYLGLTPRGYQSGEVAWTGRISKNGDAVARALLYEAANSLMVRVKANLPLKVWALKLADRIGGKKARVALARKMAVILHSKNGDTQQKRGQQKRGHKDNKNGDTKTGTGHKNGDTV